MAFDSLLNQEFRHHNAVRRYPLADTASGQDISGTFQLPNSFLVGLQLPVNAGLAIDPAKFFVRYVNVQPNGFGITVAYQSAGGPVNAASASFTRETLTEPPHTYLLGGVDEFFDSRGHVMIGDLTEIDDQPPGRFEFNFEDGRLDPDAIRPEIRGLLGIRLRNGSDLSELLTGPIELAAGANTRLTVIQEDDEDPRIVIDAIDGEGTVEECLCEDQSDNPPVRLINEIPPTVDGRFFVVGDDCAEISTITNGIQLRNRCAAPCCDCEDMAKVTQDLQLFGDQAATLNAFQQSLAAKVNTFESVVLGSKLNDRSCFLCPPS